MPRGELRADAYIHWKPLDFDKHRGTVGGSGVRCLAARLLTRRGGAWPFPMGQNR